MQDPALEDFQQSEHGKTQHYSFIGSHRGYALARYGVYHVVCKGSELMSLPTHNLGQTFRMASEENEDSRRLAPSSL